MCLFYASFKSWNCETNGWCFWRGFSGFSFYLVPGEQKWRKNTISWFRSSQVGIVIPASDIMRPENSSICSVLSEHNSSQKVSHLSCSVSYWAVFRYARWNPWAKRYPGWGDVRHLYFHRGDTSTLIYKERGWQYGRTLPGPRFWDWNRGRFPLPWAYLR